MTPRQRFMVVQSAIERSRHDQMVALVLVGRVEVIKMEEQRRCRKGMGNEDIKS